MPFPTQAIILLVSLWMACTSCVHKIHVTPLPHEPSPSSIPRSLQLIVSAPSLEGADHRAGIALLKWSQSDLNQAILGYLRQRGTFASVSGEPGDFTLRMVTKLFLSSRRGLYHYRVVLEGEMSGAEQAVKSYRAEQSVTGSSVRWVTDSDRVPIETALRLALEDLTEKIENDRSLYLKITDESEQ
jgi:hypothetical protein